MRPILIVRRASVAAASLALAILPSAAGAAATWSVAHLILRPLQLNRTCGPAPPQESSWTMGE